MDFKRPEKANETKLHVGRSSFLRLFIHFCEPGPARRLLHVADLRFYPADLSPVEFEPLLGLFILGHSAVVTAHGGVVRLCGKFTITLTLALFIVIFIIIN